MAKKLDITVSDLADDLTMLAFQLREFARGDGNPVLPWTLDDWLLRYRAWWESERKK